jgi:2-hydroxy-3-keto-5-methylthiopentenyl-1-phosphate phosphatase
MQSQHTSYHTGFDTGKAALLAYTNLDQIASTDDMDWHKSPNTRNTVMTQKSADISATVISQGIDPIVPSLPQ